MTNTTQAQMFYAAQRENAAILKQALWMAGLDVADPNPNPMTRAEVERFAQSKRASAWAFASVLRVLENMA